MSFPEFPMQFVPVDSAFTLVPGVAQLESVFTGTAQSVGNAAAHWQARLEFDGLLRDAGQELIGFLWSLNGSATPFWIGDWGTVNRGAGGNLSVAGAGQTGTQLTLQSDLVNTRIFEPGDMLQVGSELKGVCTAADSDAQGVVVVNIQPRLRVAPANGAAIITQQARGLFKLAPNQDLPKHTSKKRILNSFELQLVEYL